MRTKRFARSRVAVVLVIMFFLAGMAAAFGPLAQGAGPTKRLGFWVDERDIWSGIGFCWSAAQFVQNYFQTAPYPSAMVFATGLQPSGGCSPGATGEATWLSQVASAAAAAGLNVEIIILFFVNLSGATVNGVPDQTAQLTTFMSNLGHHSNIYGAEYEREYYGNTLAENQAFGNIITGAGYTWILDPSVTSNWPSNPQLSYSTYPYFSGTIPSSIPSNSIGMGYGETGAPSGGPAWTQTTVQAIVDSSPANPYVLLYAGSGYTASGQPAFQLWDWSTLRNWIWSDANYQNNYIFSTAVVVTSTSTIPPTTSTITSTSTSTSTTTSTITTTYTTQTPPPPNTLAVDGSSTGYTSTDTTNSLTMYLSTNSAPDLIVLTVAIDESAYHVTTVLSPDLTWFKRTSTTGNGYFDLEEWYAVSNTKLYAEQIVIGSSGSDYISAQAFGLFGVNTASPFDGSPSVTDHASAGTSPATSISTSNANDVIVGLVGAHNPGTLTMTPGLGLISSDSGLSAFPATGAEGVIVSTTQSGLSVGWTLGTAQRWSIIADAIKQQSISTTTTTQTTTSTITSTSTSLITTTSTIGTPQTTTSTQFVNPPIEEAALSPPCGNHFVASGIRFKAGTFYVFLGSDMYACEVSVSSTEVYFTDAALNGVDQPFQSFGFGAVNANVTLTKIAGLEIDATLGCHGASYCQLYYYYGTGPIGHTRAMGSDIPFASYYSNPTTFKHAAVPSVYNSGTYLEVNVTDPITYQPIVFIDEASPGSIYVGTFSYIVIGGGASNPPTLAYTYLGVGYNVTMAGAPTQYAMDAGTGWAVTNPLHGSTGYERWMTPVTPTSGSVGANFTESYPYYRQENVPVYYTLSDPVATTVPTFTFTSFGTASTVYNSKAPVSYWIDYNVPWSAQSPFTTVPDLKTYTGSPPSGVSIGSSSIDVVYGSFNACGSSNPVTLLEQGCIVPAVLYTWSYPLGIGPWLAFVLLGVNVAIYNKSQSIAMGLIILLVTGAVFAVMLPAQVGVIAQVFLYIGVSGFVVKLILLAR